MTRAFHSLPEDVAADLGAPWEKPEQPRLSRKERFARGERILSSGPRRAVGLVRPPRASRKAGR